VRSKARWRERRGRRRCRRDLQCLLTSKVFDAGDGEGGGRREDVGVGRRRERQVAWLVAGFREQEQE
jgi:hypothetical protein